MCGPSAGDDPNSLFTFGGSSTHSLSLEKSVKLSLITPSTFLLPPLKNKYVDFYQGRNHGHKDGFLRTRGIYHTPMC